MRLYEVRVEPACGSDYYQRKSAFVDGVARLDGCCEGFKDGFGGFEALPCRC